MTLRTVHASKTLVDLRMECSLHLMEHLRSVLSCNIIQRFGVAERVSFRSNKSFGDVACLESIFEHNIPST